MKKLLVLVIVLVFLLGCTGSDNSKKTKNENKNTKAPDVPSFEILHPSSGETIPADGIVADVEMAFSVSDVIIRKPNEEQHSGEGHFHVMLDRQDYEIVYAKSYLIRNVPIGNHTITVELVNNDHTPFDPRVINSFEIKVEVPVPKVENVFILDFSFDPQNITIESGSIVSWQNKGNFPQTVSSDEFDSGVIAPGANYSFQFNNSGEYFYRSNNYPAMVGRISVE